MTQSISDIPYNQKEIIDPVISEQCCENKNVYETETGEFVCQNCGIVHGQKIASHTPRAYDATEIKKRRHHEITTMNPYPTPISTKGFKGNSPNTLSTLKRISRLNLQSHQTKRSSMVFYNHLVTISSRKEIPIDVVQTAWIILQTISKKKMTRGKNAWAMTMATIYESCLIQGFHVFMDDFLDKIITKRILFKHLMVVRSVSEKKFKKKKRSILGYIDKTATIIGINPSYVTIAHDIYKNMIKNGYKDNKDPKVLSTGLLFVPCKIDRYQINNMNTTQRLFAEKTGITEVSLRSRIKDVLDYCTLKIVEKFNPRKSS